MRTSLIRSFGSMSRLLMGPAERTYMKSTKQASRFDAPRALSVEADALSLSASTEPAFQKPAHVIVDFDETLTIEDTTAVLAKVAARINPDVTDQWAKLVENFGREYARFLASEAGLPAPDSPAPSSFQEAWLSAFLDRCHEFDKRMAQLVSDAAVLKGFTRAQLATLPPSLTRLRPGSTQVLRRLRDSATPLSILSISFSSTLIAACLETASNAKAAVGTNTTASPLGDMGLFANELEFGPDGKATGRILLQVNSAKDKLAQLQQLLPGGASASGPSVYVGDSVSDLLCLLHCDVGIVFLSREGGREPNATLKRVAAAAGIDLVPLSQYHPRSHRKENGGRRVLYTAASWDDIAAVVLPTANPGAVAAPLQAPRVLTVAGSDSGGGAGIQADLKTFEALGAFGMSAVTALTAQNSRGVQGVEATPPAMIKAQIESCLTDFGADVIKTGMLPNVAAVQAVVESLRALGGTWRHLVVDPVMVSTSGHSLVAEEAVQALLTQLFPLASLVTPNIPEARAILTAGRKSGSLADVPLSLLEEGREWTPEDMRSAAHHIASLGPRAVLVKGGHLQGDRAVDVLYLAEDGSFTEFAAPRIDTAATHGTGCTLASAVSAYLARGFTVPEAVDSAKAYVWGALSHAVASGLSLGSGTQRPFNHGYLSRDLGLGDAHLAYIRRVKRDPGYLKCYAVTDPYCNEAAGRSMVEAVRQTLEGGATIVQLREKKIDGGEFTTIAREVLALCRQYGVPLVINDRVDVCMAVGADGVHVGQGDIPCDLVRKIIGPDRILGLSCKTPAQVAKAFADGADYVGCGGVYPTQTKEDNETIHVEGLRRICATKPLPVVAIGGVKAHNAAPCIQAGADGVAVVSGIFAAADAVAATRELRELVEKELAAARASRG